jgi:hypothetical protein
MRRNALNIERDTSLHHDSGGLHKPISLPKEELKALASKRLLGRHTVLHLYRVKNGQEVQSALEKASLWNPNLLQSASKTWGN